MYRTDKYDQSSAPRTFADLTDEAYAGQVGMADPGVAAPAYPLAAYFFDRLGMDGGKAYFNQLFSQGLKVYPKNRQVVQALASGEVSIALLQEMEASGKKLPKRELNELMRAVDRLWGRMQEK